MLGPNQLVSMLSLLVSRYHRARMELEGVVEARRLLALPRLGRFTLQLVDLFLYLLSQMCRLLDQLYQQAKMDQ